MRCSEQKPVWFHIEHDIQDKGWDVIAGLVSLSTLAGTAMDAGWTSSTFRASRTEEEL